MIRLTNGTGKVVYVAPSAIASITEAGTSSQWHGVRSFVKCFDGSVVESDEKASQIARLIENELQPTGETS